MGSEEVECREFVAEDEIGAASAQLHLRKGKGQRVSGTSFFSFSFALCPNSSRMLLQSALRLLACLRVRQKGFSNWCNIREPKTAFRPGCSGVSHRIFKGKKINFIIIILTHTVLKVIKMQGRMTVYTTFFFSHPSIRRFNVSHISNEMEHSYRSAHRRLHSVSEFIKFGLCVGAQRQ